MTTPEPEPRKSRSKQPSEGQGLDFGEVKASGSPTGGAAEIRELDPSAQLKPPSSVSVQAFLSEQEYREFLDALARKYLNLQRLQMHETRYGPHLTYLFNELRSQFRLLGVVIERSEGDGRSSQLRLIEILAEELGNPRFKDFINELDSLGVLDAMEENPKTLFGNLRPSVIPAEDVKILHDAGMTDPEAEIRLVIHYARNHLSQPNFPLKDMVQEAVKEIDRAQKILEVLAKKGDETKEPDYKAKEPKKRLFSGIGRILAGGLGTAGNLLMGIGTLTAPNAGVGSAVIASCALGVSSICQGVGDLRGE